MHVDLDVASILSLSLDRTSLSFGTAAAGATPAPMAENVTVSGVSPVVDVTSATPRVQFTKEVLDALPTTRNGEVSLAIQESAKERRD